MDKNYVDEELINYLLEYQKIWILNDIREEHTGNWNTILAVSECLRIFKEKYKIDFSLDDINEKLLNTMLKEIDENI